jgi:hypothetical protein
MKQHPHKYLKFKFPGGREAWRCIKPGCNHYKFKELFLGAAAECWKCKKPFTIEKIHFTRVKPNCLDCMPKKEAKTAEVLLLKLKAK